MMKKILLFLSIITIFINGGQQVYASSKFDETFFNLNDIVYYDATEPKCTPSGSNGSIALVGGDNVEKVWNFFKSKGLPDTGVAALLGGKWGETGGSINPKTIESGQPYDEARAMSEVSHYAFGIAQWDGSRRPRLLNYAKEKGQSWDTLELQLDFMWHELNTGYADVLETLKTGTLEEGVRMWVGGYGFGYERPAAQYVGPRNAEGVAVGNQLLAKFGGKSSSSQSGSQSSSSFTYTFIGDSITVGVKSQLESTFSGSNVKAEVGQGVDWAVGQLSDIKDTVVINLGTNDRFTNGKNLLEKLKDKKVYLVDIYGTGGNADFETTNKNIESIAKEFSNVQVLSWKKYLDENGGRDKYYAQEAGGANYHLNEEGKNLYIKFLKEKLSGESSSNTSGSCGSSSSGGKFATSDQASYQTDDGFSIISQYDPRWANKPGNNGTRGDTSCGPFSLLMAISALTGRTPDIDDFVQKSTKYNVPGVPGTGHNLINMLDEADYGVQYKQLQKNEAEINKTLDSGGLVMVAGRGPRPFIAYGHWILIRKKTGSGKWMVADPGGTDDSYRAITNKEWDPSSILPYMDDGGIFEITKK